MKFENHSMWGVVALLVSSLCACGAPGEDAPGDMSAVTCSDGQSVSPITGECMSANPADMGTTPKDMAQQQDMDLGPARDMERDQAGGEEDMACGSGQLRNPITDMCQDEVNVDEDMGDMAGDDMSSSQQDMSAGMFSVLTGEITRSTAPKNGGVGPVYVALFERNPITASTSGTDPGLVAFQRIEGVDFNPASTRVPYRQEQIPPRAEQYYITAFLDDNMNADMGDPMSAGPDRGDLISLEGIGPVTVTVDMAGDVVMLDLDLNFSMLF